MEPLAEWKRYLIPQIKFSLMLHPSSTAYTYCIPYRWIDSRNVFIKDTYMQNMKNIWASIFRNWNIGLYVCNVFWSNCLDTVLDIWRNKSSPVWHFTSTSNQSYCSYRYSLTSSTVAFTDRLSERLTVHLPCVKEHLWPKTFKVHFL